LYCSFAGPFYLYFLADCESFWKLVNELLAANQSFGCGGKRVSIGRRRDGSWTATVQAHLQVVNELLAANELIDHLAVVEREWAEHWWAEIWQGLTRWKGYNASNMKAC